MPRDPGQRLPGGPAGRGRGAAEILAVRAGARRRVQLALEPVQALRRRPRPAALARDRGARLAARPRCCVAGARARRPVCPSTCPSPPTTPPRRSPTGSPTRAATATDTVLATLLDLVDRGYYETSEATTEDEKLDLALEQRPSRPAERADRLRAGRARLLRPAARRQAGGDERDEGQDPRSTRSSGAGAGSG